jgi:hypothetical protein
MFIVYKSESCIERLSSTLLNKIAVTRDGVSFLTGERHANRLTGLEGGQQCNN